MTEGGNAERAPREVISNEGWRSVSELVRQRMDDLGLTPDDVAANSPVTLRTVEQVLSAQPSPISMRSLRMLAEALQLDVTELVQRLARPDQ